MPRAISINVQSHVPISLIAKTIQTFTQAGQPVPRNTSSLIRTVLELWTEACGIEELSSQEEALDICSQVGIARPERLVLTTDRAPNARDFLRQQVTGEEHQSQSAEELENALLSALEKKDEES